MDKTNIEEDTYSKLCVKCKKTYIGKGKGPGVCDNCQLEEDIKIVNKYEILELGISSDLSNENEITLERYNKAIENILAQLKRLKEENKGTLSYQMLYDFLITSVDDTQEPIWTEAHIKELLDNFIIKWKEKE